MTCEDFVMKLQTCGQWLGRLTEWAGTVIQFCST